MRTQLHREQADTVQQQARVKRITTKVHLIEEINGRKKLAEDFLLIKDVSKLMGDRQVLTAHTQCIITFNRN